VRALLDTHTLVWAVDNPPKLGPKATGALQDPASELLLSAGSIWELAIKIGLQKLTLSMPFPHWISQAIADLGLTVMPITVEYTDILITLPHYHRDPFDLLILAQAIAEKAPVVSGDANFDAYLVTRIS
jgi:PIN domain nuclease of toxin-antitoxin system